MALLYQTAEWHGLAKLRMHTESTLALLESLTTEFGLLMHQFQELTCPNFATVELPREKAAWNRRKVKNLDSGPSQGSLDKTPIVVQPAAGSTDAEITAATLNSESTSSPGHRCQNYTARFGFLIESEPQSSSGCCLDQAPIVAQPAAGSSNLQQRAAAPTSESTSSPGCRCQNYQLDLVF